jgi:hypothetical protein
MSERREELGTMIDAYLDGTPATRAEFERRAAGDPGLSRELELQRRVDDRLCVLMALPDAPAMPHARGSIGISDARTRRILRIAAALALCAVGAWAALARPWAMLLGPGRSDVAANVAYRELVKGGLTPIWVCGSDEEFGKYTREKLGAALTITPRTGLELVGWTYAGGLLDSSAQVLMCRADGKPVIVVMGKKADDRSMHADAGSGVTIHRREMGDVVMYEVSEREDETVLGRVGWAGRGGCGGR